MGNHCLLTENHVLYFSSKRKTNIRRTICFIYSVFPQESLWRLCVVPIYENLSARKLARQLSDFIEIFGKRPKVMEDKPNADK